MGTFKISREELVRLYAKLEGRAATIKRLMEKIEERDMEISCLKTIIELYRFSKSSNGFKAEKCISLDPAWDLRKDSRSA